jgi:hypothetical protein
MKASGGIRCESGKWMELGSDLVQFWASLFAALNLGALLLFTEQGSVAISLQTCIREILGSNLGRDTGYPEWSVSCFPSFPSYKCQISTSNRPRPLHFTSFQIHSLFALIKSFRGLKLEARPVS